MNKHPSTTICGHCGSGFKTGRARGHFQIFCGRRCRHDRKMIENRTGQLPLAVDGATWIPLGGGKFALVDTADAERVKQFVWHRSGQHVATRVGPDSVLLHRFLMPEVPQSLDVDHWNRNPLDNRRENLRPATRAQNTANRALLASNTSGFMGVSTHRSATGAVERYVATLAANGRRRWLGSYRTAREAALAYDREARRAHGAFASLNFPDEP